MDKRPFQTHFELTEEERKLFLRVKGKLTMRGKKLRDWFVDKLREEAYNLHE